jgi:glycosyltransferase involved in cell wall biosynthesis
MTEAERLQSGERVVAMVGTGFETMGGISTVVNGYRSAGLFDRIPIAYVRTHGDGGSMHKLKIAIGGYARFLNILASRRIRLVHIHLSSRASFWRKLPIFSGAKLFRKPVLLHLHGSEFMTFYWKDCGPVRRRIVAFVFNCSDAVIVLSPQWAESIRDITSNPNVEVIFNGVPVTDRQPLRIDHQGPPNILFLGRLGKRKGIYELLDALAAVKGQGTEFRLVAAGDGEIAEVVAKAHELGLSSNVEVPGWIDEHRKGDLLRSADLFVLPSHAEGLPMSLLEAMAAGLPVVCSSVGGIPTAVTDGLEGIIVPPGDINALADALTRLLTDKELRARLGCKAFERAKRDFDVRKSVDRLASLYEQHSTP